MHPMTQLKQLREQMIEELTKIPQYRALKSMERFITEMSSIYDAAPEIVAAETDDLQNKIARAIENKVKGETGSNVVKKAAYTPVQRVA